MANLLIKLFVKNYKDTKDNTVRAAYGSLGSVVGILSNLLLCIIKIAVFTPLGKKILSRSGMNIVPTANTAIKMLGYFLL